MRPAAVLRAFVKFSVNLISKAQYSFESWKIYGTKCVYFLYRTTI
jgi:hypothetical protein